MQRYTGAQINFGDLTPYLTYRWKRRGRASNKGEFGTDDLRQFSLHGVAIEENARSVHCTLCAIFVLPGRLVYAAKH